MTSKERNAPLAPVKTTPHRRQGRGAADRAWSRVLGLWPCQATCLPSRSAVLAVALLATFALAPRPASASPPSLNIFLRMRVEAIVGMKPDEAREALKKEFKKVRGKHGDLTPLCEFLRSRRNAPEVKPLLAMSLIANEQYQAARELLSELAKDPGAPAWVSSELVRVRQLIDLQKTLNFLNSKGKNAVLAPAEKWQIDEIVGMAPAEARETLKAACRELLGTYGSLAPVRDYLHTKTDAASVKPLLAIAAMADGDLRMADKALADLAKDPAADVWVLSELGRLREMQGETQDAIDLFNRALEKTEDPATRFALRMRAAQLLYDSGKRTEARDALIAIADSPRFAGTESRNYCARIAGMHGDDELVEKLFEPAGEGKERRRDLLYLGECLLRLGKPGEARSHFEAALPLSELAHERRYVLDRIVSSARSMNSLPELMGDWLKSDDVVPEQLDILVGVLGGELGRITEVFALLERKNLSEKVRKFLESPEFQQRLTALASETGRSEFAANIYRDLIARHPDKYHYRDGYVRLLLMDGDRAAAVGVYRDAAAKTTSPVELMHIASSARRMGLKDIAVEAATKTAGMGGGTAAQADLFMASLYREQGDTDKALEILRDVERLGGDDDIIMPLCRAYEEQGYGDDAIRLCQKAFELSGSERTLRKLISLMEEHNRHDEAYALWRRLWETASEPMTIIQANDRLLEIGSRTGKLADLAVEFEDRLAEGKLRDRELSLLLDIYTSVGDPVSAADILMELSGLQGGESAATHKRLLKVYMECELFGRCNTVLRKLMAVDPNSRDEYLQTLALIALERRNDGDAMVVLEKLADRSKGGILRDSFSASVLHMIGKHEEAALAYRRGLADDPNEVEAWLLWGNALAARDEEERLKIRKMRQRPVSPQDQDGHKQACGLFTVLLEEAEEKDFFVICIDGLLNARAPRHTMLNAMRRLNERIAADPHNLLLYRLAADINEDLGRQDEAARVLQRALTVAGTERSTIMRELIAMATAAKRGNEVIGYGRSLLNITEHLPPDECLSLGTMLLEKGHLAEAEAAFRRVLSDTNVITAARDVVMRYENVGLFDKAAKVIRTLLIEEPYDVELLLRLGLIEEKKGDFEKAGKAYSRALDLMIGRLPRRTARNGESADRRKFNVSEIDQYRDLAVRGLIASARTPQRRRELLDSVKARVRAEFENLETHESLAAHIEENPRLRNLAGLMRRLGFVFHRPDDVDAVDSELLRRYPNDEQLRAVIASVRRRWQTEIDAGQFLARHGLESGVYSAAAPFLHGKEAVAKMLDEEALAPAGRSAATVFLAMFGYDDLIDKALAGCDLNRTPEEDGKMLVAAGLAANRPDLVRDAVFTNLSRLRRELESLKGRDRSRAYSRPARLYRQIVAAWPVLSEQDRYTAASLYGMLLGEEDTQSAFRGSHLFLLSLTGRGNETTLDQARHYLDRSGFYLHGHVATILDRWLRARPAERRPEALRQLLGSREGEARSSALSKLATYLEDATVTDELRKEFPELARLGQRIQDADSADAETEADMAQARERFAKEIAGARSRANSDVRRIFVLHDITMRLAANMLPPEQLDLLLKDYKDSSDPFDMLIAFLLLRHAGRETEALPILRDIAALTPDNAKAEAALAALPHLLNAYGWHVPAMRIMRQNASSSPGDLAAAFRLHDPLAILRQTAGDTLDSSSRRMHAARLMASPEQFMQAARIYHADTRHPGVVGGSRSQFKAARWPDRIAAAPGGLLGMNRRLSGSVLADVARLDGGQDELMNWLQAVSPEWYTGEAEVCHQIAADAGANGLSPRLRETIQATATRSAMNCFDIKLIDALARQAPAELPKELAGQMVKLALHNWRGESQWSVSLAEVRKRMGVHEDSAGRTAALAAVCRSAGEKGLAASLGRWSVVIDLMEMGSSAHLPAYLGSLPEKARKKALSDLLPFMGTNDARIVTGEGLGPMLDAILNEGMTDKAAEIVDRYLRQRPCVRTNRISSTVYEAMIEGMKADWNEKDDAVAVALARLNRPEDYERLLWLKSMGLRVGRSYLNMSMSISPMPLMDNTNALPKPGQVDDIGRYIDIQIGLGRRLRSKGILSRESQVAQICMLGQWCHLHKLDDRAAALLRRADEMSEGMLSGRLWVADLHRLLGDDAVAEQIELQLLGLDLLPFPRVPAAIDALALKAGQGAADAAAFRVARYSNHRDILLRALRYARDQEMKQEYLDLAERLREVSTRFLPPGSPCSFKGYASVAEWSAAVSVIAAKMPSVPKPRPLSELVYDEHSAIARVIIKGKDPNMIYVPIIHDGPYSHLSNTSMAGVKEIMARCEEIADHLYGRYGVRHVLLEGLSKTFVDQYNRIPLQRRSIVESDNRGMIVHRTWGRLLAEKAWVLLPASDKPLVGPLTALGYEYDKLIVGALEEAKENGWLRSREVFDRNRSALAAKLKAIADKYNASRRAILEKDPGLKGEYAITVTERNRMLLDRLLASGEPGIVFFGAGHWQDLEKQLDARNVSYVVVVPKGVAWPRKRKDDATIHTDMLKLGCSLKQCNITLGDGGRDVIIVPIE